MAKRQLCCSCFGNIYDAVLSKKPGVMTDNRAERTDECIKAVAEHMNYKAEFNEEEPGFWSYVWKDYGRLSWESNAHKKAEKAEEKHGHWKNFKNENVLVDMDFVECSNCGEEIEAVHGCDYKYCPKCGAIMDGKQEESTNADNRN